MDSFLGRQQSTYISTRLTIDILVMFVSSFMNTFTTAVIGRVSGTGNKKATGKVLLTLFFGSMLYGLLIGVIFIPLRVPLLHFVGMADSDITISKWYYILEFSLCPFTLSYCVLSSAFSALWWFGAVFIFNGVSALVTVGVFEAALVIGNLGITGASLVTAVPVFIVGAMMIIYLFLRRNNQNVFEFPCSRTSKKNNNLNENIEDRDHKEATHDDESTPLIDAPVRNDISSSASSDSSPHSSTLTVFLDSGSSSCNSDISISAFPSNQDSSPKIQYHSQHSSSSPQQEESSMTCSPISTSSSFTSSPSPSSRSSPSSSSNAASDESLKSVIKSLLSSAAAMLCVAILNNTQRMVSNSLALSAPSLKPGSTTPSRTPGLQSVALAVLSDITSIPAEIAGIVSSICIAVMSPLVADGSPKKKKWIQNMTIIVISLCLLCGAICLAIYFGIGVDRIVGRFVTDEDFDTVKGLSTPLFPLCIVDVILQCLNSAFKAVVLSSASFSFLFLAEVIASIVFFPVAAIGSVNQFGSSLPTCFWLYLATELSLFVQVSANCWRTVTTLRTKSKKCHEISNFSKTNDDQMLKGEHYEQHQEAT
eukprot:MONOS_852.1-p1 / transcript=MONOS_852.1 / gene=MONOS_852 / organism=Monocercomonoides_exilis_PA203 / gene_product=unspecified product / transcript_product=unspecified product / location=Mono_scaffold00014:86828-89205(+) / protein_length=593 / sequence_SO=supercontig / SO=protein_coding / is_pseudo=false